VHEPVSQKIIRNTLFNIVGRFWSFVIFFILTPYIINHIGVERFGIWAVVSVLTGYLGLFDLGISTSFVKYIAEYHTLRDYGKINHVANTGFLFYLIFSFVVIALAMIFIHPILSLFHIPPSLYSEAVFVFCLGLILFGVSNSFNVFGAIQNGLQRMDISNKVAIAVSIPSVAGTVIALEYGYGLPGLMMNNAFIILMTSVINVIVAYKIFPAFKFSPLSLSDKETFRLLFTFGYRVQVSAIASAIHFQMDKFLLAFFLNVSCVTYYTVASQTAASVREIPLLLLRAILPAASEIDAGKNREALNVLYFRSLKYIVLVGVCLLTVTFLLADPFLDLWLGTGYATSANTLKILMAGYFFNILTGPGYFILNGMGKPQYGMRSSILAMVMNLILGIVLVMGIGYYGVVIGTTLSMIAAALYFIVMYHRVMEVPLWNMVKNLFLKPFFSGGLVLLVMVLPIRQIHSFSWLIFIGLLTLIMTLFGTLIVFSRYLDSFDRSMLSRLNGLTSSHWRQAR
jgi:O-antigen/teichoic acid export membrane protein